MQAYTESICKLLVLKYPKLKKTNRNPSPWNPNESKKSERKSRLIRNITFNFSKEETKLPKPANKKRELT